MTNTSDRSKYLHLGHIPSELRGHACMPLDPYDAAAFSGALVVTGDTVVDSSSDATMPPGASIFHDNRRPQAI